ncbi:hypothetical protein C8R44DRAFT_868817 [Mycena epipterygia]|nr:hypothetical protein C8R44DRAFT_868817 [Mycena epipterygia]
MTSAILITAPSQVETPGPFIINTFGQPGDPGGDRFYSIVNTVNSSRPSYNLSSEANDTSTISLSIPLLPEGGGWVIKAQSSGFNSTTFIGTSNTFSVVNSQSGNSSFTEPDETPSKSTSADAEPPRKTPLSAPAIGLIVAGILTLVAAALRFQQTRKHRYDFRDFSSPSSVEAGQQPRVVAESSVASTASVGKVV